MSHANRGMGFESLIDHTNDLYMRRNVALINKRPTPVKILGTNQGGMIRGYVEKPSTVDYDGLYKGKPIVFEAKSTKELNRFDLKNIQAHQSEYLAAADKHGGIAFVLIEFVQHRTIYLLSYETLEHYLHQANIGGRKSIPIDDFGVHAYEVGKGKVPVDYLAVVDKVWKKEFERVTA